MDVGVELQHHDPSRRAGSPEPRRDRVPRAGPGPGRGRPEGRSLPAPVATAGMAWLALLLGSPWLACRDEARADAPARASHGRLGPVPRGRVDADRGLPDLSAIACPGRGVKRSPTNPGEERPCWHAPVALVRRPGDGHDGRPDRAADSPRDRLTPGLSSRPPPRLS
jgi:hypothetical protein